MEQVKSFINFLVENKELLTLLGGCVSGGVGLVVGIYTLVSKRTAEKDKVYHEVLGVLSDAGGELKALESRIRRVNDKLRQRNLLHQGVYYAQKYMASAVEKEIQPTLDLIDRHRARLDGLKSPSLKDLRTEKLMAIRVKGECSSVASDIGIKMDQIEQDLKRWLT